jgi:hypothetical protein
MYGTRVHAGPEAEIHNRDKKNTKPLAAGNPFTGTRNPNLWKKKENSDLQ